MRNAPSVTYPVGRSAFCTRLMLGIAALGLMGVILEAGYGTWRSALAGGVAWCAWSMVAVWGWWRQREGRLAWLADRVRPEDPLGLPGVWHWVSEAYKEGVALSRVERVYDLQSTMLLRLHNPDGACTWVWVERSRDPARWLDLRRVLMAHA